MTAEAIAAQLAGLLGAAGVEADEDGLVRALPADARQTAAVVRWARAARLNLAIGNRATRARAGGASARPGTSALGDGPVAPSDGRGETGVIRLDLRRLNRLCFYEPQDLTIGVEAGMTAAELGGVLDAEGQCLPLDVPRPEAARIGAILAAHRSGPLRQFYGTVRDFIIGIEIVTPQGEIVHGGGRVVKNVAGYDLMRLMIGARGTLGVITGANFKVFPRPERTATVVWRLAGWDQAEAARTELLHSPLRPLAIELSGEAEDDGPRALTVSVRCAGKAATLARCRRELEAMGARIGVAGDWVEDDQALWQSRGDEAGWLLSAPAAAAVAALRQVAAAATSAGHSLHFTGRLGLGVFALTPTRAVTESELAAWRAAATGCDLEAWLRSADEPIEAALAGASADFALMRRLKAAIGVGRAETREGAAGERHGEVGPSAGDMH